MFLCYAVGQHYASLAPCIDLPQRRQFTNGARYSTVQPVIVELDSPVQIHHGQHQHHQHQHHHQQQQQQQQQL